MDYILQDELEEQSSQGSFTQSGRMDILATAIGKPDHPGAVRGEPSGVGLAKYFGRAPRSYTQNEPSRELVAKVREELRESLREEVRQSLRQEVEEEMEMRLRKSLREELLQEIRGEVQTMVMSTIQGQQGSTERRTQVCS